MRTIDVVVMGTYRSAGVGRRLAPEHTDAALQALEHVGIRHLAQDRYADLSGGQQQRALVARALATQPNFLILDEPTQGMDLASSTGILELIQQLHRQGITILLASHRLNVVANYVGSIALVRGGRLEIGTRDEFLTGEHLSALYGMPVEVYRDDHDHLVIIGG
jgi:ABC-type cobalamin/Fe3+-siderophores transport system ATPase subunit